jgi:GNAT superfamily N-acetyltransferase
MPFFKPPPRTWADYEFQPRWRLGTVIRRETKQNNSWTVGLKEETARDLSLNARQIRGTIRIFQGRPRDLKTRRGDAYIYYDLKKDQNSDPTLWVVDTVVEEAFQGQGLGRVLVELAEEQALAYDITQVSGRAMKESYGFWENLGYDIDEKSNLSKIL